MAKQAKSKVGRWCALFGRPMSFADEIRSAIEVQSTVEVFGPQVNIRVDPALPGWTVPLWGSDRQWIYIRRPEGIWKTRLPLAHAEKQASVCLRDPNVPEVFGSVFIGTDWVSAGGWLRREGEACSPEDLDAEASPLKAVGYDVEEIGAAMLNRLPTVDGRAVFSASDAFAQAPELWIDRKAVIGQDKLTGRRVAFGINATEAAVALADGEEIWLRFSGDMLLPVEAKVNVR